MQWAVFPLCPHMARWWGGDRERWRQTHPCTQRNRDSEKHGGRERGRVRLGETEGEAEKQRRGDRARKTNRETDIETDSGRGRKKN